jgi:nucleoside 2-deoxyribosyltransferase
VIDERLVPQLKGLAFPTFKERVEKYLSAIAHNQKFLNDYFQPDHPQLLAVSCCASEEELSIILDFLIDEALIVDPHKPWNEPDHHSDRGPQDIKYRLTPKGHIYADDLRAKRASSSQGFIAMWFNDEMQGARMLGLEPGIRDAGYRPHRVDDAEHVDRIDDRILADIRRSLFIVADLTGHRGGVYYEAGFARGLDKPVFYTCREDHADRIHFDIRQFNCIIWTKAEELARRLTARVVSVLGEGPDLSRRT